MCKLCSLMENAGGYSHVPQKEFEKILVRWEQARMNIMSRVPFESLDRLLKKLDKHFEKVLGDYK